MYSVRENAEIMREWQSRYPELPLVFDGIVCMQYVREPVKIVICLKETIKYKKGNPLIHTAVTIDKKMKWDGPEDSYWVTDYLYQTGGDLSPTYVNECRLAEVLLEGKQKHKFDEKDGTDHRRSIFRRIAHMELSKIGGTEVQSEWFNQVIEANKDLIGRQLSNFDANYYVVCGQPSWNIVKSVINLEDYNHIDVQVPRNGGKMEFWVNMDKKKVLILMYHPSDLRFDKQLKVIETFVNS